MGTGARLWICEEGKKNLIFFFHTNNELWGEGVPLCLPLLFFGGCVGVFHIQGENTLVYLFLLCFLMSFSIVLDGEDFVEEKG